MDSKLFEKKISELISIAKRQKYKIEDFEIERIFGDYDGRQDVIDALDKEGIVIVSDDDIDDNQFINNEQTIINRPFDPNLIDIKTQNLTIDMIIKRLKYGEIEIDTEFQRKAYLWDYEKQSRLIESMILKIPLPAFYFDISNDDKWQIIDGLQRISTIKRYVVKNDFKLQCLEFLNDLNGKKYDELPRAFQRRIEETNIVAYLLLPSTPKNVKYNIFKRLNTGGLVLSSQEIRNALYQGKATKFLNELSKNKKFKEVCNIKEERMLDREYCLRYITSVYVGYDNYKTDMDGLLNNTMLEISKYDVKKLKEISEAFTEDIEIVNAIMGKYSFRRFVFDSKGGIRRGPINKALFEALCLSVHGLCGKEVTKIKNCRDRLIKNMAEVYNDANFQNLLRNSDKNSIEKRITAIKKVISGIVEG